MVSIRAGSWARCSAGPAAVGEVVDEAAMARIDCRTRSLLSFMVAVSLGGAARPLALYMLQEFCIPGARCLAVLPPEQQEGGQLRGGEVAGDIGQLQYLEKVVAGLPVADQRARFAVVLQ